MNAAKPFIVAHIDEVTSRNSLRWRLLALSSFEIFNEQPNDVHVGAGLARSVQHYKRGRSFNNLPDSPLPAYKTHSEG